MLSVSRPSFEVVRDGRILHLGSECGKVGGSIDNHVTNFSSGLFWSITGHFIGHIYVLSS
jgi:hypothetical protein